MHKESWELPPRCERCGRFCEPVDQGVYYGGCEDIEPPDTSYFCARCAEQNMQEAITSPDTVISGCWWIKPAYVVVAKALLRHARKVLNAN